MAGAMNEPGAGGVVQMSGERVEPRLRGRADRTTAAAVRGRARCATRELPQRLIQPASTAVNGVRGASHPPTCTTAAVISQDGGLAGANMFIRSHRPHAILSLLQQHKR